MRVAIVTESWVPSVDGVVTRVENTVRELRRQGHEVLVIAPTTGTDIPGVEEHRTRRVSLDFLYGGRAWGLPAGGIRHALAEFRPAVVHVVNPVLMGAFAARHAAHRYPVVASYHTDVSTYAGHYHLGWLRPLIRIVLKGVYRRADLRLATSELGRQHLRTLGVEGVEVWERGVDRHLFHRNRDVTTMREKLCPDGGLPVALYVGRLAAEKGCDRLLPLAQGEPPVHVAFVGDGPDRRRLEERFYGASATFLGYLHGDELADAYAAADVFVFPSTTDTLGLVLLEAMAMGLPIVAPDVPGMHETLAGYQPLALASTQRPGQAIADAARRLLAAEATVASPAPAGGEPPPPAPGGGGPVLDAALAPVRGPAPGPGSDPAAARRSPSGPVSPPVVRDWADVTSQLVERYRHVCQERSAKEVRRGRRISRFALVGASNAVIDLGVFNILVFLHSTRSSALLVAYNTIAVLLALFNSYLWNSRWTFADRVAGNARRRWAERGLFLLQGGINLAVNDLVILGLSMLLTPILGLPATLASNMSKVGAMLTASAVSFVLMHFVVFRHRQAQSRPSCTP
ncbi:MAG TPA: glycosyltransferase [Acidimicrobiales bacterium]|nr:glycosyltransferase [Acidimicrobiales bacterium]